MVLMTLPFLSNPAYGVLSEAFANGDANCYYGNTNPRAPFCEGSYTCEIVAITSHPGKETVIMDYLLTWHRSKRRKQRVRREARLAL